jgi:phage shock protein A
MANQNIIDYQNQLKQNNLDEIARLQQTIISANQNIEQLKLSIDDTNSQISDCKSKITALENGNILIDEAIAILEQQ